MLALSEINNWQEGANSKLIEYFITHFNSFAP